jgi:integrase/recombinase XerC/integrase/recombinase XerD
MVRRLGVAGEVTLGRGADAYLATLRAAEQGNTRRVYGRILRGAVAEFGSGTPLDEISADRFAEWFGAQWGGRAPSTWNVSLDAIRSAAAYWQRQGWLAADPSRMLRRRKPRPDRVRALSRADVEQLLTREDISLRERTLWRMLYETAARSAEVLALDVGDLDLPNRCARVRRKGGAIDIIVWQTGTARRTYRRADDKLRSWHGRVVVRPRAQFGLEDHAGYGHMDSNRRGHSVAATAGRRRAPARGLAKERRGMVQRR